MQEKSFLRPFAKQDMDALYFLTLRTFLLQPNQGVFWALRKQVTATGATTMVLATPKAEHTLGGALLVQNTGSKDTPFKLCCVMIDPAIQRKRLGTVLLQCAVRMAKGLGKSQIEAILHVDDAAASAWLKNANFEQTAETGNLFPNQEAGNVWKLALPQVAQPPPDAQAIS